MCSEKKGGLADKMIKMLEQYTLHLEDIVADRTAELNAEKVKAEGLLFNILPRYDFYECCLIVVAMTIEMGRVGM